ncbi:MAG: amidophosphoribosyltransferase [Proteobacteria bacterium]|nr:amidophosphoribosyltransferase [Pseudomonadota bacterium]MBP10992.1 amidophosphoribosyltransferase [Acidiferrobacteraceae bacterium]MDP6136553.1 amidophosphoribosyltransferase [Arenicellales bacterium]HCF74608.1 amidophosphoribosyltransferase [Gammaproteobacteria bacterium]HJP10391.1 amidophosphoribosyltransferase [Arenicellales bacterium]
MCGIVGVIGGTSVNQAIYEALTVVQHRGQDAAGIMTCDGLRVHLRKDNGLVRDVFQSRHMAQLVGGMGIGHVRYPTAGCDSQAEAQPLYVNSPFGLALGHNGNLTNAQALSQELFRQDLRQLNTTSDSEVLLNVFAHELREVMGGAKLRLEPEDVFSALRGVYRRCRGAYAVIAMIVGYGLVAFRDPNGIRPLILGEKTGDGSRSLMIASESVALDVLGYQNLGDVGAGEAIFVDMDGKLHRHKCSDDIDHTPCIFEYVYFARPDSIIDDVAVHKSRLRMGEKLGQRLLRQWPEHDIDTVVPIPDTSRTSALQLANVLGVKYREGFIKNRYIGRTFIMPGQAERRRSVRQKLNAIDLELRGKNILLVDDSIVRGTTSRQIIQMARDAGARRVYFASAAPPVRHPNVYGIDMPVASELVANERSTEQICQEIGADWLIYQELSDLIEAVQEGNPDILHFDTSCFDGQYVTGDVTPGFLQALADVRGDATRTQQSSELDSAGVSVYH